MAMLPSDDTGSWVYAGRYALALWFSSSISELTSQHCWHTQIFLLCSLAIYIAIPTVFIVFGPDRIGQALYNLAQKISHLPYGWLILLGVLGTSCYSFVSSPVCSFQT